ncbi:MAG: poly(3-hydroxyalkanoate) polymerase, partial [Rhodococcus sp. (in: high G+C Gram-positive bacteria)]
ADAYVVGGSADHLCPWQSTYRSARLLGSKDSRFVLSSNGHIASLVNPPGNPRASFRFGQPVPETPDEWLAAAETASDSWWPDYARWLAERSGPDVDAPHGLGARQFPPLAPAPGTYVHHS